MRDTLRDAFEDKSWAGSGQNAPRSGPGSNMARTAALRAAEIRADALLKGTHSGVDGVYSADPRKHTDAKKLRTVSYKEVIANDLKVMDSTAITFCMDNELPIVVFDVSTPGNFQRVLHGEEIGTTVSNEQWGEAP
jgi:uridylate kinase